MKVNNKGFSNRCAVRGCFSNYQSYISGDLRLFRFPKDIDRCREWATKCGILIIYEGNLTALYASVYRVCSLHFEDKMFKGKLKKRLTETALPTLQLCKPLDDNHVTITKTPDEHPDDNLEATTIPLCQTDTIDTSLSETIKFNSDGIKQEPSEQLTEHIIKFEHVSGVPIDIKEESELIESEIDIKDDIIDTMKPEVSKLPLCEVCDASFQTEVELIEHKSTNVECQRKGDVKEESQDEAEGKCDVKEEPQDETENIYVCSMCNAVYESREELINHKKEKSECHEHKICFKCEHDSVSDFTCAWEIEEHLKIVHGVENQSTVPEKKKRYKYCIVPRCSSTTVRTPDKLFISVPANAKMRRKWCTAMKRDNKKNVVLSNTSIRYCCEDHFELEKDMENYTQWKIMGGRIRMKKDVLPHIFECQDILADYGIPQQLKIDEDLDSYGKKKKTYPCRYCPKICKRSHLRTRHERVHNGEKPYQCSVCEKFFSSTSNRNEHEAIHSGEKRFSCSFCTKSFFCNINRKRHEKIHTVEKSFKCQFCDQCFSTRVLLKEHKGTHSDTPYNCQFCPRSFRSSYNRSRHEKVHSGCKNSIIKDDKASDCAQEQTIVSCNVCPKTFSCDAQLQEHRRIHKPFECRFCGKLFTSKSIYKNHKQHVHFGEKPLTCNLCPKSFITKSKLVQHERIHTGEKPYFCRYCEKSFSTLPIVSEHEKTHTGERPFSCSFCSKSFISNFKKNQHERIHTGEKPYLCRYCQKSFSTSSIVAGHEKIHTGERAHKCQICNKSFIRKSTLQIHQRVHTGEKLCSCDICGKMFTYLSSLRKHERIGRCVSQSVLTNG